MKANKEWIRIDQQSTQNRCKLDQKSIPRPSQALEASRRRVECVKSYATLNLGPHFEPAKTWKIEKARSHKTMEACSSTTNRYDMNRRQNGCVVWQNKTNEKSRRDQNHFLEPIVLISCFRSFKVWKIRFEGVREGPKATFRSIFWAAARVFILDRCFDMFKKS